jgi:hypothetical protein
MEVLFLERGRFSVDDGSQTRFWEDLWIGNEPLMKKYPSLHSIVLRTAPLNVSNFRRAIVGDKLTKWLDLVGTVISVQLVDRRDSFVWTLYHKKFRYSPCTTIFCKV